MLETVSVVRVCKVRISLFIVKTEVEIKSWVKPQFGSGKVLQQYYCYVGDQINLKVFVTHR